MKLALNYLVPSSETPTECGQAFNDSEWYPKWLERMVDDNPDIIFFFTIATSDIWEEKALNYRELLSKYIQHVSDCEGVNFLADHHRSHQRWPDSPVFTDEEWAELKRI